MSDLYNDGRTTTTGGEIQPSYDVKAPSERDKHFQEFREFDYGLDIDSNIILVQDEISQGMVFDTISKVRLSCVGISLLQESIKKNIIAKVFNLKYIIYMKL